jgi:hypothetical protein
MQAIVMVVNTKTSQNNLVTKDSQQNFLRNMDEQTRLCNLSPCKEITITSKSDLCYDDSELSDMTGLTGVFSACSDFMNTQDVDNLSQCKTEEFGIKETLLDVDEHLTKSMHYSISSTAGILPKYGNDNLVLRSAFRTRNILSPLSRSKKVTFDTVSVRYYERILTIHPSTTLGPSIGIGWKFQSLPTVSLDQYEMQSNCNNPHHQQSTYGPSILDRHERVAILRQVGVTDLEIVKGIRMNIRLRHQRAQSIPTTGAFQVESVLTSILRNKLLPTKSARKLAIR